jgi:sugar-specific transcriptional regulator TrmB
MSDNMNNTTGSSNNDLIIDQLRTIGLGYYESKIYLELLNGPRSHLKLAQATGINRTKVYRLVEELEKQSLVSRQTDDTGTFLVASDPSTLEVALVTAEEELHRQRIAFDRLMPTLKELQQGSGPDFAVNTYEGIEGLKQMLWHELKAQGEVVLFGSGAIQDLVADQRWAEKHRTKSVEANYTIREIINPEGKLEDFTDNKEFLKHYTKRYIDPSILHLDQQTVIYNDTVATYNWRKEQKVGVEIISASHATMMRQVFESFWLLAE